MKSRAFTLIELLVVVLIIGILAAIAVPQYQKSVDKSKYSELMFLVKYVKTEQEVFYMQKGRYATSCTELGITPPSGTYLQNGYLYFNGNNGEQYIDCAHANRVAGITTRFGGLVSYEHCLDNYPCAGCILYYAHTSSKERGKNLIEGQPCTPVDMGSYISCIASCPNEAIIRDY